MRFSIRDLFLVTVIVAVCVAWWVDRSRLAMESKARGERIFETILQNEGRYPRPEELSPPWKAEMPNPTTRSEWFVPMKYSLRSLIIVAMSLLLCRGKEAMVPLVEH